MQFLMAIKVYDKQLFLQLLPMIVMQNIQFVIYGKLLIELNVDNSNQTK